MARKVKPWTGPDPCWWRPVQPEPIDPSPALDESDLSGEDWARSFWACVDQSGGPDACWPWMGPRSPDGYGMTHDADGTVIGTHRYVLEITLFEPLGERFACHKCDNPPCCNPAHLYAGTPADNARDVIERGRRKKPVPKEPAPQTKPSTAKRNAAGETVREEATRLGISRQAVDQRRKREAEAARVGVSRQAGDRSGKQEAETASEDRTPAKRKAHTCAKCGGPRKGHVRGLPCPPSRSA